MWNSVVKLHGTADRSIRSIAAVDIGRALLQTWLPEPLSDPKTGNSTSMAASHLIVRGSIWSRSQVRKKEEGQVCLYIFAIATNFMASAIVLPS